MSKLLHTPVHRIGLRATHSAGIRWSSYVGDLRCTNNPSKSCLASLSAATTTTPASSSIRAATGSHNYSKIIDRRRDDHRHADARRAPLSTASASSSSSSSPSSSPRPPPPPSSPPLPTAPVAQQVSSFPSLVIGPDRRLTPLGSFASAQAAFLDPPSDVVERLLGRLVELNVGIVAHYYMDVELQGVLHAVRRRQMDMLSRQKQRRADAVVVDEGGMDDDDDVSAAVVVPEYPLVAIADSLRMGDDAVRMCADNSASAIVCLGVDFMSESVSAIMGRNGHRHVPVYRATHRSIGCSLAESAEGPGYRAWLHRCVGDATSDGRKALHVVYINTSLETKAISSSIIPTITCTSSNVLQTILQASSQLGPGELRVCYGPDTYMGENLVSLLDSVLSSGWSDDRIRSELHPRHDRDTIRMLRDNVIVYPSGNCVVHHMFGSSVVEAVERDYPDAYVTAHLEVPGEMFHIALRKSLTDGGVVGSTSNILNFIERKVGEAAIAAAAVASDVASDVRRGGVGPPGGVA